MDGGTGADFLAPRRANHAPLSPITFLERAAQVFPERAAVVHGSTRRTYREFLARCLALASALRDRCGVGRGSRVAVVLSNTPEMLEVHFAVPLVGACLCPVNTRLDAAGVAFILHHSEAQVLLWDSEFSSVVADALALIPPGKSALRTAVLVEDSEYQPSEAPARVDTAGMHSLAYETLVNSGAGAGRTFWDFPGPADEWDDISLNYTSGTTGNPKGVLLHHRGAYLNSFGNVVSWGLRGHPTYLWTLPMFHCNGWCFPWTITMLAGTHVCLRSVSAGSIFAAIEQHRISHFCGAPIIMQMVINATDAERRPFDHPVQMMTAAAPPPAPVLAAMREQRIEITHVYGLSEVYGPVTVCAWHEEWHARPPPEQAALKARQGVRYPVLEGLMVGDPETLQPVPKDGATIGEIFMRGNVVMKGYLKNAQATEEALRGGWFHTGDLAVWHPDGYIQIADRSKDVIISGGENISSVEVADALYSHPAVGDCAVVAQPHDKWGEVPCAFVELKPGHQATAKELEAFCLEKLARFKRPKTYVFGALPKTSTGKIQKFILRDRAKALPRAKL